MQSRDSASEPELRGLFVILRRRRWTILAAVLSVLVPALVASFVATPTYAATAKILLRTSNDAVFDSNSEATELPADVPGEIEVIKSEPVRAAVRAKLGTAPPVSVRPADRTDGAQFVTSKSDLVRITARSTRPERAATVANTYATAYIDLRQAQTLEALSAASQKLQAKIVDLGNEASALDRQVGNAPPGQRNAAAENADQRRKAVLEQQALFKRRLDQLQVDASVTSGGARIVSPAAMPRSPVSPKPLRNGALALFVGLNLGIGLAFLREYLDDRIKTKEDVERVVSDVPVLGLIPAVSSWKRRDKPEVISLAEPGSAAAEAYRALRTSLHFMGLDAPYRLQVTSPNAGEGKSTTLANLAVTLARSGQRVVLVCCDLRRPRIHEFFGLQNAVGFTSVVAGDVSLREALQTVPGVKNIGVLASGPVPTDPSELLASPRAASVLSNVQAAAKADVVLVDSPPLLPVTDAVVLSTEVDATVAVVAAGSTTRSELRRGLELLRQVDAPVAALVLNGVSREGSYGKTYQYRYYGATSPRPVRETVL